MYTVKASAEFDAAHFLSGYSGKCANIHGHRWVVCAEICREYLCESGQERGMAADFKRVKADLKELAGVFDHALIYESGTLKDRTLEALKDEGFALVAVDFRPTAENFAEYFYKMMKGRGYGVKSVTVNETPENSASYSI